MGPPPIQTTGLCGVIDLSGMVHDSTTVHYGTSSILISNSNITPDSVILLTLHDRRIANLGTVEPNLGNITCVWERCNRRPIGRSYTKPNW